MRIRRALLTVSDKRGLVELGRALVQAGAELVATGKTATVLKEAGLAVVPIEEISGSPEAFQGRMKTLSFPVCSGILARRGDASDDRDLEKLKIRPIDCVVVNFYPFEAAAARPGISRAQLIEEVDIGGPTLVRAAAKNAPDVLVLTDPDQYTAVIEELQGTREISEALAHRCASRAWDRVLAYDSAIAREIGGAHRLPLRYGENPHQSGVLDVDPQGAIAWPVGDEPKLTATELSYNNITDVAAAYGLASDLLELSGDAHTGVVIVKHGNPCGVASIPTEGRGRAAAQKLALLRAWEGDPVSAFGGVLAFTHALELEVAEWLAEKFVELIAAPVLTAESPALKKMLSKRKNLKAVRVRRYGESPMRMTVAVPGGVLTQTNDLGLGETLRSVTKKAFAPQLDRLARFGIAVTRSLRSNAIAIVREIPGLPGALQLVGAGQGQPNRVEALEKLAVPRARGVLEASEGTLEDCLMVSDAFFPFRDTVDRAFESGLRRIVQPGGSMKDAESIAACDEHGISMAFTGVRHFKH